MPEARYSPGDFALRWVKRNRFVKVYILKVIENTFYSYKVYDIQTQLHKIVSEQDLKMCEQVPPSTSIHVFTSTDSSSQYPTINFNSKFSTYVAYVDTMCGTSIITTTLAQRILEDKASEGQLLNVSAIKFSGLNNSSATSSNKLKCKLIENEKFEFEFYVVPDEVLPKGINLLIGMDLLKDSVIDMDNKFLHWTTNGILTFDITLRTIDATFGGMLNQTSEVKSVLSIQARTVPPGQYIVVNSKIKNWEGNNEFVTGRFFPEYENTSTKGHEYLDISKAAQEGDVTVNKGNLLILLMNTTTRTIFIKPNELLGSFQPTTGPASKLYSADDYKRAADASELEAIGNDMNTKQFLNWLQKEDKIVAAENVLQSAKLETEREALIIDPNFQSPPTVTVLLTMDTAPNFTVDCNHRCRVCNELTNQACGRCGRELFCNLHCQSLGWPEHANHCRPPTPFAPAPEMDIDSGDTGKYNMPAKDYEAKLSEKQLEEVQELLHQHRKLFSTDPVNPRVVPVPFDLSINTGNAMPISVPSRQTTQDKKIWLSNHTAKLLASGCIRYSQSPWQFPVHIANKAGPDKWRFCVDYKKLNDLTIKDKYPLPTINNILTSLNGATVFSTLDLASGFYHVSVSEEDKEKTAFRTHTGLYEWNVMPFGLTNGPPHFQRVMDWILKDHINIRCFVYIDDIIIFSKSAETHMDDLRRIFATLEQNGLYLRGEKCKLFRNSITFLGKRISKEGISMATEKVQVIKDMPVATNKKELQYFLNFAGYYRHLIPHFAMRSHNLREAAKADGRHFVMTPQLLSEYNAIKTLLTSPDVVHHPDFSLPFIVMADASEVGLGGVLAQRQTKIANGVAKMVEVPIAFISRTLRPEEKGWPMSEKEALAAIWAMETFSYYIGSNKVILVTD